MYFHVIGVGFLLFAGKKKFTNNLNVAHNTISNRKSTNKKEIRERILKLRYLI